MEKKTEAALFFSNVPPSLTNFQATVYAGGRNAGWPVWRRDAGSRETSVVQTDVLCSLYSIQSHGLVTVLPVSSHGAALIPPVGADDRAGRGDILLVPVSYSQPPIQHTPLQIYPTSIALH